MAYPSETPGASQETSICIRTRTPLSVNQKVDDGESAGIGYFASRTGAGLLCTG